MEFPYYGDAFDTQTGLPLCGQFPREPNVRGFIALSAICRRWMTDIPTIASETGVSDSGAVALVNNLTE